MRNVQKMTHNSVEPKSATDTLKTTTKSVIQKTAESTGDLIGNELPLKWQKFTWDWLTNRRKINRNAKRKDIPRKKGNTLLMR